jgi:hypothetical protein
MGRLSCLAAFCSAFRYRRGLSLQHKVGMYQATKAHHGTEAALHEGYPAFESLE